MRYMVNVKSAIILPMFYCFLLGYISYLIYDNNHQNIDNIKGFGLAKRSMAAEVNFDAVLLGGSNVAYSLSAQQLTLETDNFWFNFGLSSEAFTDQNYWKYIEETIDEARRSNIEFVVYSSILPLKSGHILSRKRSHQNTWGETPLGFFPSLSLAHRLKSFFNNPSNLVYQAPLARGDFNFENKECNQNYIARFEREMDEIVLQDWINSQLKDIKRIFPNARIIFVVPSEFYGDKYDREVADLMNNILKNMILSTSSDKTNYFSQPIFPSKNITCDSMLHGNLEGREWRTKLLAEFFSDI